MMKISKNTGMTGYLLPGFLLLCLLMIASPLQAERLQLAVASNFAETARELGRRFERETAIKVSVSSASTGKLVTQIRNGAPFDILFSADLERAQKLAESLSIGPVTTYAIGQLLLVTHKSDKREADPIARLKSNRIQQVALANHRIAPYGAAARRWLEQQGLSLEDKQLLTGENIIQAWQYFAKGGADAVFVSASVLHQLSESETRLYEIEPLVINGPSILEQGMLVIRQTQQTDAFIRYLETEEARKVILSHGYSLPTP